MTDLARFEQDLSFWGWLAKGTGGRAGWRLLFNRWLGLHVAVGLAAAAIPFNIKALSGSVLLPLGGVLVGLCFAWSGSSQAFLQSREIRDLAEHSDGGFTQYVYSYQLAILVVLVASGLWGLGGAGVFDQPCVFNCGKWGYVFARWVVACLTSLSVRESWGIVLYTHRLAIAFDKVERSRRQVS